MWEIKEYENGSIHCSKRLGQFLLRVSHSVCPLDGPDYYVHWEWSHPTNIYNNGSFRCLNFSDRQTVIEEAKNECEKNARQYASLFQIPE